MSYSGRQVNTSFFKYFWQNMSNLCPNFNNYQDEFFFKYYTYPATQKIGINLAQLRNLQADGGSVKEYLTCLTSYIFSITPQAQIEGMTFGKGDVVPFLYFKDRNHANIDVRHDSEALMDIAKYAYVALIEGWCNLPTPYHLWENEYNWLFGTYNPNNLDYDLETLHEWYDETYQRYYRDKGRKGNSLLGSDIDHIIASDYSIETQLEATEYYIRGIFNDLGIETDFKEIMARNELMAKYMMEHSNFDDVIKDYNVAIEFMTENLQRGTHEEQNTHTVVTSDFQKLEFPYTMDKRNINHSDEDGISDGDELGTEKWINITEFVRKTYEDAVRNGKPHKATFEAQVEDIIEKNGAYIDSGDNKVYGSVKWNDDKTKVLYRVYDYKSNPKLNDTDFDGLNDNTDSKPIDNKFKGNSNGIGRVEYNQDFRWFMTNNKKYNDEIAVMSLIMSNLADGKTVSTDQASGDIDSYLRSIGFSNIQNIGEGSDNIYIAKKTIEYYDTKKDVVGVFLGQCDRWLSEVIKYKEEQKVHTTNMAFKESLESYISRIVNKINLLDTSDCSYWAAGYDVGGSIASEVASKLVEDGKMVYAYTFGAFNTSNKPNIKNEIKNIRNEDDFAVKFITGTKPGENYGASIFENLMFEYRDLTNSSDYDGNYVFTNYLLYVYDETKFLNVTDESDAKRILTDYFRTFNKITNQNDIENYADLTILLNKWADGNKQAHSIKSYYVLAKSLNGFDILDWDGEKQNHYKKIDEAMVLASTGREITKGDDELGDLDGYPFAEYNDVDIDYDASDEATVHIKNFMYSNYTIDSNGGDNVERDINYVKFWKEGTNNGKLSEYKAGDYSKNTVFTYEGRNSYYNSFVNSGGGSVANTVGGIYTIHGRILAAFPPALKGEEEESNEFKKSTSNMNRVKNYKLPNRWQNNVRGINSQKDGGDYNGKANITLGASDMYKLVDCVFENGDGQQFVVPFIIMDAKKVHLLPNVNDIKYYLSDGITRGGKMSNLTDNRYGQVNEYIKNENPVKYEYNIITNITDPNDEKLITRDNYNSSVYDTTTYIDNNKPITYFSRDEARDVVNISPIEPLATGGSSNDIMRTIFGDYRDEYGNFVKDYRLISMRIYKDRGIFTFNGAELDIRIADNNGVPLNSLWYGEKSLIDDNTSDMIEEYGSIETYLSRKYKDIVKY